MNRAKISCALDSIAYPPTAGLNTPLRIEEGTHTRPSALNYRTLTMPLEVTMIHSTYDVMRMIPI